MPGYPASPHGTRHGGDLALLATGRVCAFAVGGPEATAVCSQREAPGAQRRCLVLTQSRTWAPSRASPSPGAGPPPKPRKGSGLGGWNPSLPLPKAAEPRVSCHSAFCPADHCEKSRPGDRNT